MTELNIDGDPIGVYLAEPVDQSGKRSPHTIELHNSLDWAGYTIFAPREGFRAKQLDPWIEKVNRHALYTADVIVAHLPAGIPSIGVPAELEAATARGIPAVVLTTVVSQVLAGNPLVTVIDHPSLAAQAVAHAVKTHPRGAAEPRVKVVLANVTDPPPDRAYADDAGLDLTAIESCSIGPGGFADIATQVDAIQLPDGYWGMIVGRSSTFRRKHLHVPISVIDPGWRGPLFVGVWNYTSQTVPVAIGDRLGQLILVPLAAIPPAIVTVDQLDPHPRGNNGFGSSG